MPSRLARELLNQAAFIARIENIVRHLNQRIGESIVFDVNRCRIAHQKSRSELEIALDTANEHELFEAFDAFLDLLVENLIKESISEEARNWRHPIGYLPLVSEH